MARVLSEAEFNATQKQLLSEEEFNNIQAGKKTPGNTGIMETVPYAEGKGFGENAGRALHNVIPGTVGMVKGVGQELLDILQGKPVGDLIDTIRKKNYGTPEERQQVEAEGEEFKKSVGDVAAHPMKTIARTAVENPVGTAMIAVPAARGALTAGRKLGGAVMRAGETIPGFSEAARPEMKTITTSETALPSSSPMIDAILNRMGTPGKLVQGVRGAIDASKAGKLVTKDIPAYPNAALDPNAAAAVEAALKRQPVEMSTKSVPRSEPFVSKGKLTPEELPPDTAPVVDPVTAVVEAALRRQRGSAGGGGPIVGVPLKQAPVPLEGVSPPTTASELEAILAKRTAPGNPDIARINAESEGATIPQIIESAPAHKPARKRMSVLDEQAREPRTAYTGPIPTTIESPPINPKPAGGFTMPTAEDAARRDAFLAKAKGAEPPKQPAGKLPVDELARPLSEEPAGSVIEQILRGDRPISTHSGRAMESEGIHLYDPDRQRELLRMKAGVKGTPYAIEDVLSGSATPDMLQSAKSQMKRFGPGAAVPEELSPHVQLIESQGLSVNGITPVARLPKNMQGRGAMFWFTDPQTGSTLAMFENDMTAESIAKHIADSRQGFPK